MGKTFVPIPPKKGLRRMAVRTPAYKRPSRTAVMKTNMKKPAQYVRKQEKPSVQRHGNDKDRIHPTMTLVELH
eukprot:929192-Amphidinium_carterae.1